MSSDSETKGALGSFGRRDPEREPQRKVLKKEMERGTRGRWREGLSKIDRKMGTERQKERKEGSLH